MPDEIRVGVVGTGILGRRHARVFSEIDGARVAAVADPVTERAVAAAPPGAEVFADVDTMLARVPLDAVAVATPDHLHLAPVSTALQAGKHVLVEKPLATTLAEAQALVELAARRGVLLQVNYSQRWVAEYAWMKEQIDAGLIGRPVMAFSSKQDTISVPTRMISWAAATSPIFFMSSHDIDLIAWFLGGRAVRVQAQERRGTLQALGIDAADGVDALVSYDTGATANFHSSWIHPASLPAVTVDRMDIIGESGLIHFESLGREVQCYTRAGGRTITFSGPQTANEVEGRILGAFRSSLERFLEAIRTGAEPATSAASTLHVTATQAAILKAAVTGRAVTPEAGAASAPADGDAGMAGR